MLDKLIYPILLLLTGIMYVFNFIYVTLGIILRLFYHPKLVWDFKRWIQGVKNKYNQYKEKQDASKKKD